MHINLFYFENMAELLSLPKFNEVNSQTMKLLRLRREAELQEKGEKRLDISNVKTCGFDGVISVALRLWFENFHINKSRIVLFCIQQLLLVWKIN